MAGCANARSCSARLRALTRQATGALRQSPMSKIGIPENGRGPAETGWPCEIWRGHQGRLEVSPRKHSREPGGATVGISGAFSDVSCTEASS